MKLNPFKKSYRFKGYLVQKHRSQHEVRIQRKRFKMSKLLLENIKIKIFDQYKYVILWISLIVVVGGGIGLIYFSNFFSITSVVVERTDISTNIVPLQQALQSQLGKNIFLISEEEIEYMLQKQFPEMKEIKIIKLLPRTLKVKVLEYSFIARIRVIDTKEEKLLNEIGMIRDIKTNDNNLPLIEYRNKYDIQEDKMLLLLSPVLAFQDRNIIMSEAELKTILNAKALFEKQFGMKISLIQYFPLEREIHLKTERNFFLWLDLTDNIDEQLMKLQSALQDFNIYKVDLSYIDLRVKNKIIYCTNQSPCVTQNIFK